MSAAAVPAARAAAAPVSSPAALGARPDGSGTAFAVFSSVAEDVDLCLFDETGAEHRLALRAAEGYRWEGRVEGVGPGTRYGYRVHGPWDPAAGARCNPAKLLLDPYARAVAGGVRWHQAVHGAAAGDPGRPDDDDSAPYVPRSVVWADDFDWGNDGPPATPLADSIVYELHVKGFTRLHPGVPEALRGTYAGLGHPAALEHLVRLGVTAVELMPVHQFVHDEALAARGLENYWGYQSIGFFAPHNEYSASGDRGAQVVEFKGMVRALHAAGLEVILDVVFNHTAEGGADGPTLCFRGIDNAAYYRLTDDLRSYVDDTGCGNTVDTHRPPALRLVMDSLRYWVEEMHVDGFRFDLAASLGRAESDFDPHSAFLQAVGQDPVLSRVKLIAEPWDTGWGGYEVGDFPPGWSEWNGMYRDTVRDFWRGVPETVPDLATRLTGSSDLYGQGGRRPTASINFVTAHDGFTLADLVAYDRKHNEANGEGNRDGTDDNRSWNCGVEGPTADPAVLGLRARQRRNLLATLLLSQGVPMILGGDELGHTQAGNNNAYCQDGPLTWLDWSAREGEADLSAFVADLCRLRRDHRVFRRRRFLRGPAATGGTRADIGWFRPDGALMGPDDWAAGYARAVVVGLSGLADEGDAFDDPFLLVLNAWWERLAVRLPGVARPMSWTVAVDTSDPADAGRAVDPAAELAVGPRSVLLLHGARPAAGSTHSSLR
ncbi:MAG TPA: glycogen debranching protein GlgX [Miltoncostaeaceae bacterium]|nr:glycogen debranching protein GlgX [Miltoncostaeaceae bacterium]